jgi:sulfite exporter TauE/SafE
MIEPQSIDAAWPAFLAGVVTSMHCVGMCGPMACFVARKDLPEGQGMLAMGVYHGMRLFSYALIGAIAGGMGAAPLAFYSDSVFHFGPWGLVMFFLVVGLGLERFVPKPKWLGFLARQIIAKGQQWHPLLAPVWIGLGTPLLPCGPLYLIFAAALLSGSAARGAEFTFVFGLGTLPLLWLGQTQWLRWQGRIHPVWRARFQRGVALCGAIWMATRLLSGPSFADITDPKSVQCPMCRTQIVDEERK